MAARLRLRVNGRRRIPEAIVLESSNGGTLPPTRDAPLLPRAQGINQVRGRVLGVRRLVVDRALGGGTTSSGGRHHHRPHRGSDAVVGTSFQ